MVDFYIVNEKDLKGNHTLEIQMIAPDGKVVYIRNEQVNIKGGETFGQLLLENVEIPVNAKEGTYRIEAAIKADNRQICARGHDEVVAVGWQASDLSGNGAYYGGSDDKVAAFYKKETGKELPAFSSKQDKLDWLVVSRPLLNEPVVIPPTYFTDKNGNPSLKATWYSEGDMNIVASVKSDMDINRTFVDGAQPDASVLANQPFSRGMGRGDYPPNPVNIYLELKRTKGYACTSTSSS